MSVRKVAALKEVTTDFVETILYERKEFFRQIDAVR
jgi:hypothetical protein